MLLWYADCEFGFLSCSTMHLLLCAVLVVSIAVCFIPHGWITFPFCSKGNEFGTRTGERFKGCKCYLHGKQSDFFCM